MSEPTIFKVELLENTTYNDAGDILNIKFQDDDGSIYYYDSCNRWCYLEKDGKWKKLDWKPKQKTKKINKIGYLRRDDDGHWFLIPEEEVEKFDKVLNQELPDMFVHTGEEFDDLYETEMLKFSKYRLSGGVSGLKVLME